MSQENEKIVWSFRDVKITPSNFDVPDFDIYQGQRVALVGDNKTLRKEVFMLMCGLRVPNHGKVIVEGTSLTSETNHSPWADILPRTTRRKMGIALEKDGLLSNVSVKECLETLFRFKYGTHNEGLLQGAHRLTQETASALGLTLEQILKRPSELDPLERRLAALCLAFMTKPQILLLENPTLTLSERGWEKLSHVLTSILGSQSRTFVLETTDWLIAYKHADLWMVFHPNNRIEISTPEKIIQSKPEILAEALKTKAFDIRKEIIGKLSMEKAA